MSAISPRVLIVRFSAIGDCVMAVPVASAIRRTHPEAFIAWAIDQRCKDVLDVERLVDLRFEVPRQQWKKDKTSWLAQLRHFSHLRSFQFDYGIDLQGHSKTALCLRFAAPKERIAAKATDVMARVLNPVASRNGCRHTVECNLHVLQSLMNVDASTEPIMPRADTLPELPGLLPEDKLITISVGAGSPEKTFPLALWTKVGARLVELGYEVAFLGGPEDPSPRVPGAHIWVGKLSLAGTMGAVARSRLHLAADTGTGHIAAAYQVPVISVFGYTDPEVYRPYTNDRILLDAGKGMDRLSPERIVEAADRLAMRRNAVSFK